ncbi:OstA-like protein [Larkinella sp.]|uniref:OstA-like protein n=1 Tax=Larkinella sp. TaxID=2034517 RepID=UPI003BAB8085
MSYKLLVVLLFLLAGSANAQIGSPAAGGATDIVILKRADQLEGVQSGTEEIRKLTGNVELLHKNTLMFCDRAVQNLTTNVIEAYGNVRMIQGDTLSVRGDTLFYYGASRQANVTGRTVVLKDRKMTLTTRRLDYDMANGIAHYPVKGRIVDRENILTSREGYYNTQTKLFTFHENVKLVNPQYTLTADSLLYNSLSKIATFQGPTKIVSKEGTLLAKDGDYNTVSRLSNFQRRATIETEKYTLTGDTLFGNNANDYYTARGNVVLFAKGDQTILTGDFGRYNRKAGVARMIGHALVKSISSSDTLFMRADTLWSFELPNPKYKKGRINTDSTYRRLIGQRNVLVFKNDLQSKCDSIVYETADSTIYFFKDPIVWSTNYQMEGDSITALMKNNRIHKMLLRGHSFVISQDTLLNFNQVKGRTLTSYFAYDKPRDRSDIDHVVVEGNGESLYFAVDDNNKMVGMNRVLCSKMTIRFADRKVNKISFYGQPDSKLVPPQELKEADKQLDGFNWRMAEKPTKARILGLPEPTTPASATVLSAKNVKKAAAPILPETSATTKREIPVSESKMKGMIRKTTENSVGTAPVKEAVSVNKPAPVPTVEPKKELEKVKTAAVQPVDSATTEAVNPIPVKTTPEVTKPKKVMAVESKKPTVVSTEKQAKPVDSLSTETLKNTITKPALRTTPAPLEESDLEKELNKKPVRKTGN